MCFTLVLAGGEQLTTLGELTAALGELPPMRPGEDAEDEGPDSCLCRVDVRRAAAMLRCRVASSNSRFVTLTRVRFDA